jgi:exodeoxyribonuclease VII large subunit
LAEPAPSPTPRGNVAELTVSELAGSIKRTLEGTFGHVRLRGEISGYRGPHSSGHCYFTLKDDKARIDAVIWRGVFGALRFKPAEGLEVVATGKVSAFPGSSKYQIVIEALEPAGVGALMALLEERKRTFAAEGLFAEERKRPLPFLPRVVGIVTSPTGAVIRDMLAGFTERFPTRVVVWPVRVQGETSAAEVAAAIRGFDALPATGGPVPRPDVIIVARGGGSLEDLWGFNEEVVVRAVAACRIPLVSAVGHETDWTLIDLVADARAPTPTKAAEWVVPKYSELIEQTAKYSDRLRIAVHRALESQRTRLRAGARGLPRLQDLVALPRQRLDAADRRLGRALLACTGGHGRRLGRVAPRLQPRLLAIRLARSRDRIAAVEGRGREALARLAAVRRSRLERVAGRLGPQLFAHRLTRAGEQLAMLQGRAGRALAVRIDRRRRRLAAAAALLSSLGYARVLARGFAIVRDGEGRVLRSAAGAPPGSAIGVELADGTLTATVDGEGGPARTAPTIGLRPTLTGRGSRRASGGRSTDSGSQGSLF